MSIQSWCARPDHHLPDLAAVFVADDHLIEPSIPADAGGLMTVGFESTPAE
jgi:hypothetical protein